ncbi:MAG: formylglycine-generating enzyme family protein [Bacteroidetes bacterium]|nr:formylglycine-generating enzyme family protein [Bacteroidota bacterium]MBS1648216.1 formylglycine-generating enzyme family protein [Bacteroidota bacterium]
MKISYLLNAAILIIFCCASSSCKRQEEVLTSLQKEDTQIATSAFATNVKMQEIKGGYYKPFYSSDSDALIKVEPFLMDERPVTNAEFLAFVKANPQWKRSAIKRIYADTTYLHNWVSDTALPKNALPNAPVTYVSWFAAKAYATAVGKRLPTLDEWEFVAMADETSINARNKKTYSNNILNLYLIKNRQYNAVKLSTPNYWGIYNMFDLVWEWTDDFNSVLINGESRSGDYNDKNLVCAGSATSATDVLNYAAFMRYGFRSSLKANYTISNLGFRCANSISNKTK